MKAKFEMYKDVKGEFRWRFKATNGLIIAVSSEGYSRKADCERSIQIVQTQAAGASVEDQTIAARRWRY